MAANPPTRYDRWLRPDLNDWVAIGLLAFLVILTFGNVVFGGKSLIPTEHINPLDHRANEEIRGESFISQLQWQERNLVPYPNFRDVAAATLQFEPSQEFLRRSLLRGEFPFWDPYIGGGNPSFASLVPAYLFPPGLAVVLLGNGSLVRNAYILMLIFSSGVVTYFLLRRHDLSWQASIAGAIAFAYSGAVVQTAPTGLGQPVAFFALPLLVTARFIELPGPRRAAQLALAYAFVALASFPPILMQTFGLCVVYVFVAMLLRQEDRQTTLSWYAAGVLTSLAVVAVAYVPAVKLMREAVHINRLYRHAGHEFLPIRQIAQILSPTIMGGSSIYTDAPLAGSTSIHLYYTGVVALVLAGLGILTRPDSKGRLLKIAAALTLLLALGKVFGAPPIQWISYIPMLRNIHYAAYFGIVVAFTVSLIAALGVDALVRGRVKRWHLASVGVAMALALSGLRFMAWRSGVQFHAEGWRWIADFRLLVLFLALAIAMTWLTVRGTQRRTLAVSLILGVLALEGITNSVYPRPMRWNVWRNPPDYVQLLLQRKAEGRVLPVPIYPANTSSVFGHSTLDTIMFSSTRMQALYRRYFNPDATFFLRDTRRFPPERVMDAANIEYLAIGSFYSDLAAEAVQKGYETIHASDLLYLMKRKATPRYSFTSDYRVSHSPADALESLANLPSGIVLLDEPPSFPAKTTAGRVIPRLVRFSLNEVELAVETSQPGLLVCSESNMSGWTATVDEQRVPILAANYAFRAVEVPAGMHRIRFRYWPPGLSAGIGLTFAGLTLCLTGLTRRSRLQRGPAR